MSEPGTPAEQWDESPALLHSPSPTYRSPGDSRVVSYSLPSPGLAAQTFLAQAVGAERFFWEDVRDEITFAGFGVAAHVLAWGPERFRYIQSQARALFADAVLLDDPPPLAAPRLFGGFSFRDDFVPDNTWSVYHPAHFVLPHYQLVQVKGHSWLTINALVPFEEDPAALLPQLREALLARQKVLREASPPVDVAPHATPTALNYPLPYPLWAEKIEAARAAIRTTELRKVVLARMAELRFGRRVDVDAALAYLNRYYSGCYRFLFEPRPHHAFFGATPELLVRVRGETLTSMILAGSIGRSDDEREDEALGQRLLRSAKDRHEHELVMLSMLERLAPLTSQLEISPQPGVHKLRNIQHLFTPVRARLLAPDGVLPLVHLLHPTPALGGSPRALAMQFIQEAEPVPRGWYAAPVGWIDYRLDGAFAVAIRSAVSQENRAWLYAGAGIVADSQPRREWEETALKFQPMLHALGAASLEEEQREP